MLKSLLLITLIVLLNDVYAQYRTERYDTSFYVSYRNKLNIGPAILKKKAVFKPDVLGTNSNFGYTANNPAKLGVAMGYDFFNIALTYGVEFLDPLYSERKGTTRQRNLQLNLTGKKVLAELLFQKNKGFYYKDAEGVLVPPSEQYYIRPDIEARLNGVSVSLIKNDRKFSTQAAFLLDAWQKKSAGSLLYGGDIYFGSVHGDSAFMPSTLERQSSKLSVSDMSFITFGPGAGYGYTLVVKEHFFATGMLSINAGITYIKEWSKGDDPFTVWRLNPNVKLNGAVGYNSEKWAVGVSYFSNRLFFRKSIEGTRYLNSNESYKVMYIRRVDAGKAIPKVFEVTKKLINTIGLGFLVN